MTTDSQHDKLAALQAHIEQAILTHLHDTKDVQVDDLYDFFLEQLEKPLLTLTLRHTRGNQSKTAQMLGLNRGTLRTKLKRHGLL